MEELRKRNSELEALFKNVHEMFFSIDMQANALLQISPRCEQIYGYNAKEFQRNPLLWLSVVLDEDRPIIDKYYPALSVGRPIQQTHRIVHKNGTIKWVETKISPTLNNKGKLVRIDGITSDVTARKEAEEKLERRIHELVEINDELREINEELDRFVYSASHELRAPLASVQGLIDLMQKQEEDPKKLKLLEMMQTKVERLDLFIQDIVHFARNSRLEVECEKIDFKEVINESIDQLRYMPDVENICITTELQVTDNFYSDKKRLSVVLNNLLSNAIKYSNPRAKHPFIHIYVRQTPEEASLEIRDNGMGIQEAYLDKIFNMFFRATKEQSGSGLGLFIVKEIIEKMDGVMSVNSQEGEGSTFQFHIPNLRLKKAV